MTIKQRAVAAGEALEHLMTELELAASALGEVESLSTLIEHGGTEEDMEEARTLRADAIDEATEILTSRLAKNQAARIAANRLR